MKERRNLLFQMQTVAIKGCRKANPRLHLQKNALFPHIVFYNKKTVWVIAGPSGLGKRRGGLGTFLRGESFGAPLISMVTISSGLKDIGRGLFTARQFIYKGGGHRRQTTVQTQRKGRGKKCSMELFWGDSGVFIGVCLTVLR